MRGEKNCVAVWFGLQHVWLVAKNCTEDVTHWANGLGGTKKPKLNYWYDERKLHHHRSLRMIAKSDPYTDCSCVCLVVSLPWITEPDFICALIYHQATVRSHFECEKIFSISSRVLMKMKLLFLLNFRRKLLECFNYYLKWILQLMLYNVWCAKKWSYLRASCTCCRLLKVHANCACFTFCAS